MKLSDKLANLADAGGALGPVYGVLADEARALEWRAENAEAQLGYVRATVRTQEQTAQELEERVAKMEAVAAMSGVGGK